MMPRMSGAQMVKKIRAHRELDVVPIVMLTAKADDELRVRLLREGVQDAIKFRGARRPRVEIAARRRESEWVFSVADNGIESRFFDPRLPGLPAIPRPGGIPRHRNRTGHLQASRRAHGRANLGRIHSRLRHHLLLQRSDPGPGSPGPEPGRCRVMEPGRVPLFSQRCDWE